MAYREVRVMDIEQVIRRWTAGEAIRAIARTTDLDRNTVRGLIRQAEKTGLKVGEAASEEQLQLIRKGIGQPGASSQPSEAEQCLQPHRQRIQTWLIKGRRAVTDKDSRATWPRRHRVVVCRPVSLRAEVVRVWKIVGDGAPTGRRAG
jgi:hypothetical protein